MTYRLTRKASANIRQLYSEGVRLFGTAQADRCFDRIEQTLPLLADSPNLVRERTELSPPARIHPAGSHVVVYTVENDGIILIVRVRHGREDWADSP